VHGPLRLVFFGTPSFALPTLAGLVAAGRVPALVVTQPARPVGRGGKRTEPPVAAWAREHGLAVAQPERVKEEGFLAELAALVPDLAVVVAFGQIFPRRLLALPQLGCINVHASLLPRWRGAAPIQAAIAAGDAVTGVTIQQMVFELDAGDILLQRELAIEPEDTTATLAERLAELGAALTVEAVTALERGGLPARPQEAAGVTHAGLLRKEDGRVAWSEPAAAIWRRLRAYTPWPGLTAELEGRPVKVVAAHPEDGHEAVPAPPGTVLGLEPGRLRVACGERTVLALELLQRPGKGVLPADTFAHGERLAPGAVFG
jgi:methionyl-tRNA formyltransferase